MTGANRSKRDRNGKPYEYKNKMMALLGFDTLESFDKWRISALVKPLWNIFVTKHLKVDEGTTGHKLIDFPNLCTWIQEGEMGGNRRFERSRETPDYTNPIDWHAWRTFWLAHENVTDKKGCFFGRKLDKVEIWRRAHNFIVWAKRQRQREIKAASKSIRLEPRPVSRQRLHALQKSLKQRTTRIPPKVLRLSDGAKACLLSFWRREPATR